MSEHMLNWLTSRSPHGDLEGRRTRGPTPPDSPLVDLTIEEVPGASTEAAGLEAPTGETSNLASRDRLPGTANTDLSSSFSTPSTVLFTQGTDERPPVEEQEASASPNLRRSTRNLRKRKASADQAPYRRPRSIKKMTPPVAGAGSHSGPVARTPVLPSRSVVDDERAPPIVPEEPVFNYPPSQREEVDLASMIRGMETRLGSKMDRVEGKVISLERRMDKGDDEFESKVRKIIADTQAGKPASTPATGVDPMIAATFSHDPAASAPTSSRSDRQELQFYEHRRSLRMWPVPGKDLKAGVKTFLTKDLGLDNDFFEGIGDYRARRYRDPRSKAQHEVVVTYENREVADAIRAKASNLAGRGNAAGIRLHVPGHLLTNFKVLENLGYQMRAVDGSVRRVIKFDDQNLDLMMDVKIKDRWRRVRPAEAKAAKSANSFGVSAGPEELSSVNIADFFADASSSVATGANASPME